jgi:hypothetical protein
MFNLILAAIRVYVIKKLAEQVADDIITNGLTEQDQATIDAVLASTS